MLTELKGYIGLLSNGTTVAQSGLYVDALPDISVQGIERIISNEATAEETWERIEDRALLKFRTLFIGEVNKCHKLNKIDVCECLITENKEVLATALWYLLGAEVMLTRTYSSRINAATIDRSKNKELRDYFESQFKKELETAVASIDIHASECVEDTCVEIRDVSTFHTPIL